MPERVATGTRGARRVRRSAAARRASRTDSGSGDQPARRPSSTTGGTTGASARISAGSPHDHGLARAPDEHDPVGVLHDPLEAVLGQQHGDAEVVHQAGERGEDVLGRGGVEGGGRLVEHQHPGRRR